MTDKNQLGRKEYLDRISPLITKEQYGKLADYLNGLSEKDWDEIKAGMQEEASLKESLNMQRSILEKTKTDIRDTAWYTLPTNRISEDRNRELLEKLKGSSPSDNIYLTSREDGFLIDLWETDKKNVAIPSDLFFANTVPLLDCVITIDERRDGGEVCDARIVIFDDYAERIKESKDDAAVSVGVLIPMASKNKDFFLPITVVRGVNSLIGSGIGTFNGDVSMIKRITNGAMAQVFVQWMETWYGIQIALLHPAIKDVFKKPSVGVWGVNCSGKKRKRKVKYIRNHYLTIENMEKTSGYENERKINRKCLAWYVIGHWRVYPNGNKIFVKPYWKGPLRELKKNADGDERHREV